MFDLSEWHLPRNPWEWVVRHCKDLLLPHLWWQKQMHYSWLYAWLFTAKSDLWAVQIIFVGFFFHTAQLLHLSIPSGCLKNTIGPLLFSSFCLLAPTNISLPSLLFVPFLPPSLPLPLSLINTYCKRCLPLQIPKDRTGRRDRERKINTIRKRSGNSTEQERNWHSVV